MLLSTAIPMVIAAIVIVIMSRGIPRIPIIPKINKAAIKFGTTPIIDRVKFLNNRKNIIEIPNITIPSVRIWDLNKLSSKLLNKIKTPDSLYSSEFSPSLEFNSFWILSIKSFRLKSFKESFTLILILASLFSTEM